MPATHGLFHKSTTPSVTAGEHLLRGEGAVFDGMPLAGQFWKERGQIVLSRLSHLTRADRAAGSAAGSGIYRRLPAMAFSHCHQTLRLLP